MDGILLIDKPAGWTSHDVVAKVRIALKQETGQKIKVGHTGTLDPLATGLLILVIGSYTKRASEFSKLDKAYEARLTLGKISTTGDTEGQITPKADKIPNREEIEQALSQFKGKIQQTPHKFSAVKVGGKRAYHLARQGKEVNLEPRQVTIHKLEVLNYEYPSLSIKTRVSSGTYIRSLAEDIGEKLGVGAYLSGLRRTQIDQFDIGQAIILDRHEANDLNTLIHS